MTIQEAHELLDKNFELALDSNYVQKPIAWALHRTWSQVDRKERSRYGSTEETK